MKKKKTKTNKMVERDYLLIFFKNYLHPMYKWKMFEMFNPIKINFKSIF